MINLLVYSGDSNYQGVCPQNVLAIGSVFKAEYYKINFSEVTNTQLGLRLDRLKELRQEKNTILAFPGGVPTLWDSQLVGTLEKIREFIEHGGKAFMICAGAYYSCELSVFNEKSKMHGLNFFPGIAKGPINPENESSQNQAKAVEVIDEETGKKGFLYFNQGGHFIPNSNAIDGEHYKTLLKYNDGKIAAVECNIGEGTVIMTFIHPEYSEFNFNFESQPSEIQESINAIRQKLSCSENFRIEFIKNVLKRFFSKA